MQIGIKILGYLMLLGMISYFGYKWYLKSAQVEDGTASPNFNAQLIDNSPFQLSELRGQWVVLDFWGSWCGPCLREIPELIEFSKKIEGHNIQIVTVALEKDKTKGIKASAQFNFHWKYQIVEEAKFVMLSPTAQAFGVTDIPAKFLISPEGEIQKINHFSEVFSIITP